MKAVVRSAGSMLLKDGISQPSSCGAKEVLVDVKAAGINPVDYKVIRFFPRTLSKSYSDIFSCQVGPLEQQLSVLTLLV